MEIERSETNFSPGIVYFSEHKKSAGSFHSATFWVDWKRVRRFTGSISGPKDCGSKKIEFKNRRHWVSPKMWQTRNAWAKQINGGVLPPTKTK